MGPARYLLRFSRLLTAAFLLGGVTIIMASLAAGERTAADERDGTAGRIDANSAGVTIMAADH